MDVVGFDNAVRNAVLDRAHLLGLQLQLKDRTMRPVSRQVPGSIRNSNRLQKFPNGYTNLLPGVMGYITRHSVGLTHFTGR